MGLSDAVMHGLETFDCKGKQKNCKQYKDGLKKTQKFNHFANNRTPWTGKRPKSSKRTLCFPHFANAWPPIFHKGPPIFHNGNEASPVFVTFLSKLHNSLMINISV